jgi:separase
MNITRVALLSGCSSIALPWRNGSIYEGVGAAFAYLVAGAPAVVGCLWDVTDREIDTWQSELIRKLTLKSEEGKEKDNKKGAATRNCRSLSLVLAKLRDPSAFVSKSSSSSSSSSNRSAPTRVTLAAVVCYGLPVAVEMYTKSETDDE